VLPDHEAGELGVSIRYLLYLNQYKYDEWAGVTTMTNVSL
jgi:hypothetical protein